MNKYLKYSIISSMAALVLSGCGGGTTTDSTLRSVTVKDSVIHNLDFNCDSYTGVSSSNGVIQIPTDCKTLTFSIGNIEIGSILTSDISTDDIIYISELLGLARTNTTDEKLVKLLQFIQSLDENLNPEDGIQISSNKKDELRNHNFNFRSGTSPDFDKLKDNFSFKLVDIKGAIRHYEKTIRTDFNSDIDTVPPMVPGFNEEL